MPKFKVQHNYSSYADGRQFGPYEAGDLIEVDAADAEWLEHDSPGLLKESKAQGDARPAVTPTLDSAEVARRHSKPGKRGLTVQPRGPAGGDGG